MLETFKVNLEFLPDAKKAATFAISVEKYVLPSIK